MSKNKTVCDDKTLKRELCESRSYLEDVIGDGRLKELILRKYCEKRN